MKAWTKYLPNVMPDVSGCPRQFALQAVRDTAIDFCEATKVWQEVQDPYSVGGGIQDYDFSSEPGIKVWEVRSAHSGADNELDIRTAGWCDDNYPGWRANAVQGFPVVLTQLSPEGFLLVPTPVTSTTVTLTVALKPTRDSTKGPDFLFEDYYEAICAGAKGRLMLTKGKPWTDPQAAALQLAFFNEKITEANVRRSKAFGRGVARVEGSFF